MLLKITSETDDYTNALINWLSAVIGGGGQ